MPHDVTDSLQWRRHCRRAGCVRPVGRHRIEAKLLKITQAKQLSIITVFIATVEFIATAGMMKIIKKKCIVRVTMNS